MAEPKKLLAFLSLDVAVTRRMVESVQRVIGHEVDVTGYSTDEGFHPTRPVDLLVLSGSYLEAQARTHFPNTAILVGHRMIDGNRLDELFLLPRSCRALVVLHPREASQEAIRQLLEFGIDHLEYDSYWNSKKINPADYDCIITPSMFSICPPGIPHIIDIGPRGISFTTFTQILQFFDLDSNYLHLFERNYTRMHVDHSRRLVGQGAQEQQMRRYQEAMLDDTDTGMLLLDAQGRFLLANQMMDAIFGNVGKLMENRSLQNILQKLRDAESDEHPAPSLLYKYRDKTYECRRITRQIGNVPCSLTTFRSTEQIQDLAYNVRNKLRYRAFAAKHTFEHIWGQGAAIERAKQKARRFASTGQTILLTGESGTGKELFAQAIHNVSERALQPFVAVNLAAVPATLMESELFGYVGGAFTDAKKTGRQGMFELANGGTIFLDEIGDAPVHIQLLLLRVLEEREILRIGAESPIPVDVRVIAATNKNLWEEVAKGSFRRDLFFRLNVLPVQTVPLREMGGEVLAFLQRYLLETFGCQKPLTPAVGAALRAYDWPGNFRELKNVAEYLYYSSLHSDTLTEEDIPEYLTAKGSGLQLEQMLTQHPLLLAVLQALHAAPGSSMGRGALAEALRSGGIAATDGSVRHALTRLGEAQLVQSGSTRQGTALTPLGVSLVEKMRGKA